MASVALLALSAAQIVVPVDTGTTAPAMAPAPAEEAGGDTAAFGGAAYPAILERPLFSPDRRPAPAGGPAAEAAAFTLIGVGTAGDAATALLRAPDGQALRILPGQSVEGWQVISIEPNAVTLGHGDRRIVLEVPKETP
ncbi:MAG: hypothetical protein PHS60_17095 [Zavarzinia sp.]|nr:hypothetical protein [Zavarzinia sp.]